MIGQLVILAQSQQFEGGGKSITLTSNALQVFSFSSLGEWKAKSISTEFEPKA